jgi:hypothetical protein
MDQIFAAAAHEAAHGVKALDSPDIRVKSRSSRTRTAVAALCVA